MPLPRKEAQELVSMMHATSARGETGVRAGTKTLWDRCVAFVHKHGLMGLDEDMLCPASMDEATYEKMRELINTLEAGADGLGDWVLSEEKVLEPQSPVSKRAPGTERSGCMLEKGRRLQRALSSSSSHLSLSTSCEESSSSSSDDGGGGGGGDWGASSPMAPPSGDSTAPDMAKWLMFANSLRKHSRDKGHPTGEGALLIDGENRLLSSGSSYIVALPTTRHPCRLRRSISMCVSASSSSERQLGDGFQSAPPAHRDEMGPYLGPITPPSMWKYNGPDKAASASPVLERPSRMRDRMQARRQQQDVTVDFHAIRVALHGFRTATPCKDLTLYSTTFPCMDCATAIHMSGVRHVVCPSIDGMSPSFMDPSFHTVQALFRRFSIRVTQFGV